MAIDKQEVEKFKASLSLSSEVLIPSSEGYAESIKRWSSAAEKPAVGTLDIFDSSSLNPTRGSSSFQQQPETFPKPSSLAKPTILRLPLWVGAMGPLAQTQQMEESP